MTVYQLRTFKDFQDALREELGVQAGDTTALNRIKRHINIAYEELLSREQWKWLRGRAIVSVEPQLKSGTVSVTKDSTAITLSSAPATSKEGYYFRVGSGPTIYTIASHVAGATAAELTTPYIQETNAAASFQIWTDKIALPSEVRETFEVIHDLHGAPMVGKGLQEFRRLQVSDHVAEGAPIYYSTGDYKDPDPYEAISGLPTISTIASNGMVKTIVFQSSVESHFAVGDRIRVSGANHYSYNQEAVVSSVSASTITYTGRVAYQQIATADTPTLEALNEEGAYERYREFLVHPAITNERIQLKVDYIKDAPTLVDDTDEPLIPISERIALLYAAAERCWQYIMRNPEAAEGARARLEAKLSKMQSHLDDSTDYPRLQLNRTYMSYKRSIARRSWRSKFYDSWRRR